MPAPAPAIADPFAHPDALRRIRLIADQEELEQALAFPWEKWGVFLHPFPTGAGRALLFGSGARRGFGGYRQDYRGDPPRRAARPRQSRRKFAGEFLRSLWRTPWRRSRWCLRPIPAVSFPGSPQRRSRASPSRCTSSNMACAPASPRTPCCASGCARRRIGRAQGLFGTLSAVGVDQRHRRLGADVARRLCDRPTNGAQEPARPQSARRPVAGVPGGARGAGDRTLYDMGEGLHRPGGSPGRRPTKPFDHVIIDEAQDLAPAELRFFAALAPAQRTACSCRATWASAFSSIRIRGPASASTCGPIAHAQGLLPYLATDSTRRRSAVADGAARHRWTRGRTPRIISVIHGPSPEVRSLPTVAAEGAGGGADRAAAIIFSRSM